jgi:hypothetical protein
MPFSTQNMLGADLSAVYIPASATGDTLAYPRPPFAIGTKTRGTDGSEWTYVTAAESLTQYYWVGIDENFAASLLTDAMAADGWIIGVTQVLIGNTYSGWVCTQGANVTGRVALSVAADTPLHTSAVAGVLDDLTSVGTKIDGVVAVTGNALTSAGANVEVLLTFPRASTF